MVMKTLRYVTKPQIKELRVSTRRELSEKGNQIESIDRIARKGVVTLGNQIETLGLVFQLQKGGDSI